MKALGGLCLVALSGCVVGTQYAARQLLDEAVGNPLAFEGNHSRREIMEVSGTLDLIVVESKEKSSTSGFMIYGVMAAETEKTEVRYPVLYVVGERGAGYVACELAPGKSSFKEVGEMKPGQAVKVRGTFRAVTETKQGLRLTLESCSLREQGSVPASYEPVLPPVESSGTAG